MITINIFQTTREKIDQKEIKSIILDYLVKKKTKKRIILDVLIINKEKIQLLNKKYRKINEATDVLSFPVASPAREKQAIYNLGSLVICPEIVWKNAKTFQKDPDEELKKVIIHSLNHLWNQK